MNLNKQTPAAKKPEDTELSLTEWFLVEFWPRFGKQSLYALIGIVVVIAGAVWFNNDRKEQQAKENKELGPAFMYFGQDKLDSAEAFLNAFVKATHSRLVTDKANLMLGQINYTKGKYDEAIKDFGAVDLSNASHALIASGALHGLASSEIQKKDYAAAADNLEKLVSRFGRRTGSPKEKVEGSEVADLSPAVPNALWKLALCYRELKNNDKAKAAAEKLVKVYPEARESFDATRFLAQLQ